VKGAGKMLDGRRLFERSFRRAIFDKPQPHLTSSQPITWKWSSGVWTFQNLYVGHLVDSPACFAPLMTALCLHVSAVERNCFAMRVSST